MLLRIAIIRLATCTNTSSTATTQIRNPTTYGTTLAIMGMAGVDAGRYLVDLVASCYPAATSPISNSGDTSRPYTMDNCGKYGWRPD